MYSDNIQVTNRNLLVNIMKSMGLLITFPLLNTMGLQFKGTVCNDLSNLLTQIKVFVHK